MHLEVEDVVFTGLASSLAVLTAEQKELGSLVIDLGAGTTEFVAYSHGVVKHTGVLAVGTLLNAWIGRRPRFREWAWLVYPLLVLTGLKMVAQHFSQSRPATLFIALALYGAALIVAPRLRKRRDQGSEPDLSSPAGATAP